MNYLLIIIIVTVCILVFMYMKCIESFTNAYEYDIASGQAMSINKIVDEPYIMYIDDDARNKAMTQFNKYGTNDELYFNTNVITLTDNFFGQHPLIDKIPKWPNEMEIIVPVNECNIDRTIPTNYGKLAKECGGLGNVCSSDYDYCNDTFCYGNKCQQI